MFNWTCPSFFAGVGGIDKGFELAGFKTIYANEFDETVAVTFTANFPTVKMDICNIKELDEKKIYRLLIYYLQGFLAKLFL